MRFSMSRLDELIFGFDEALEWPFDDEDAPEAPTLDPAAEPLAS